MITLIPCGLCAVPVSKLEKGGIRFLKVKLPQTAPFDKYRVNRLNGVSPKLSDLFAFSCDIIKSLFGKGVPKTIFPK